jgi:hypothetical protein
MYANPKSERARFTSKVRRIVKKVLHSPLLPDIDKESDESIAEDCELLQRRIEELEEIEREPVLFRSGLRYWFSRKKNMEVLEIKDF